ncbi:MAG TPA: outer membrane lipoprotein carrier protein LolA [Stellaceae bacterium]|nr:outer membrane lipoprotein carrier protein LolA [Stellaceae bacterium]
MTMMMRRLSRRYAITGAAGLAALALLRVPTRAAPPRPAHLSAQDEAELARIQTYLNDIKTLQARFQQFSGEGGTAAGTIYLQRPGKMRIVYDDPTPILIIADGREVYYWDKKLQELSQINVDETPAWFLLRPEIKLSGDVTVTGFEHAPGALRIAMTQTKNPDQGSLSLVMSERPLELRQWTVIDAQQKPITVALEDPHFGAQLNPNLFIWTEQRSTSGRGK